MIDVNQDQFKDILKQNGVMLKALCEVTGFTSGYLSSAFNHTKDRYGEPTMFSDAGIDRLNRALPALAQRIVSLTPEFDKEHAEENRLGNVYDPKCIEQFKTLGKTVSLVYICDKVLGWSQSKRVNVLTAKQKAYGNISEDDVLKVKLALQAIVGQLTSLHIIYNVKPERPAPVSASGWPVPPRKRMRKRKDK